MIPAIDIHCHFNHGSKFDAEESENSHLDLPFLINERKRLNINICSMAGTFASVLSNIDTAIENEYLYSLSQETPFLYQWVVIDPRNEKTFQQAELMLKSNKCLGIKIHPRCHKYPLCEFANKIFSFANDKGTVVLIHPDFEYNMDAIHQYADMKVILAHLGSLSTYYTQIIKEAKHQNVYTDTSGAASYHNNVIEYTVQQVGSEKILFGTDTYSCAFQRGRIDYANILEADKENIFYKNALNIFPQFSGVKECQI